MTAQASTSPRLGDARDRFLAQWSAPVRQQAAAGGQVLVFPQAACLLHVLFLDGHAVAIACPYRTKQPHVRELEALIAPFQPAVTTPPCGHAAVKPAKLYVDDHGWTLALRRCSAEQVEALVQVAAAAVGGGE